jgi:hypothetical protein
MGQSSELCAPRPCGQGGRVSSAQARRRCRASPAGAARKNASPCGLAGAAEPLP